MRAQIVAFDTYLARVVGKIPASVRPLFHTLGLLTMPVVWCGVLAVLFALQLIPRESFTQTMIVIAIIPLGSLLKYTVRRKRPPTIYANHMKIKTSSFPSSHSYASFVALGYLAYLCLMAGLWVVAIPLVLLAAVIGISRVHLGAHYPSDVIGGWLLGVILLTLVIVLF